MENKMNLAFLISLWATFLVIRVWTHNAQDLKNYGTKEEKSFTLTGVIRARTGYDLHHIHFGFLLTISTLIYIYFNDFSFYPQIAFGIGISFITDQAYLY